MSTGSRKRPRGVRNVSVQLRPSWAEWLLHEARRADNVVRVILGIAAAVMMIAVTRAWQPQFVHRQGDIASYDVVITDRESAEQVQAAAVAPPEDTKEAPRRLVAKAGEPLSESAIQDLSREHAHLVEQLGIRHQWFRMAATAGLLLSLYGICGYYVFRRDPRVLRDLRRYATLLVLVVVGTALATWTRADPWRAEVAPVVVFALTAAIAYNRELALLLTASLLIFLGLADGYQLGEFVILAGTAATAVLALRQIRSRTTLIWTGMIAGLMSALLTLGVGLVTHHGFDMSLFVMAGRNAMWAFLAGFLMTGLLPFIESAFGVLTEISLLELGDASHPLLQELVRRAPGTYSHSITVASIAEAAAASIDARRLLVRVGAYFHDIGKMLKPGYFAENQGSGGSRHDTLAPAMSTLIIVAHVKDGVDLARQHHLPEPIIDLIEQHHGTTLVEYFYRRANQQSGEGAGAGQSVSESSFRYPGPKPQTREAAVLMLADAAESASRALVEPTPSRIENLVEDIAMKRLLDGQFDDCGLTLQQLRTVEDSLIKSLTAVYHGRVKYPDQRTA